MPDLHFVEISKDRLVYVGERGQNRIEVFTTEGKFVQGVLRLAQHAARGDEDAAG